MIFSAKLVTPNEKGVIVFLIGGFGFFFMLICLLVPALMQYAGYLLAISLIGMAIGFIAVKGDVASYHMDEKLIIYNNRMEINRLIFPFAEVENLQFVFVSFQGMKMYAYEPDPDADLKYTKGTHVYGIDNSLSFRYKGQAYDYRFHIQNQKHFFQFVQMLEQLYMLKIPFSEKNWHGKTFMMNNVSNKQYQELKQSYE